MFTGSEAAQHSRFCFLQLLSAIKDMYARANVVKVCTAVLFQHFFFFFSCGVSCTLIASLGSCLKQQRTV